MKYIKKYEKIIEYDDIEISDGSYWIIYGSIYKAILVLQKFKKLLPSNELELEVNRVINRLSGYRKIDKENFGTYLYFSSYGFSYSILNDEEDKLNIYYNQLKSGIYDFKGELNLVNYELVLDDSEKTILSNTNKFNI